MTLIKFEIQDNNSNLSIFESDVISISKFELPISEIGLLRWSSLSLRERKLIGKDKFLKGKSIILVIPFGETI